MRGRAQRIDPRADGGRSVEPVLEDLRDPAQRDGAERSRRGGGRRAKPLLGFRRLGRDQVMEPTGADGGGGVAFGRPVGIAQPERCLFRRRGGRRRDLLRVAARKSDEDGRRDGGRTVFALHGQRPSLTAVCAGGVASTLRESTRSRRPRKARNAA